MIKFFTRFSIELIIVLSLIASIVFAILFSFHVPKFQPVPIDSGRWSDYGTFLAGIFSFAAFIAVLWTFREQKKSSELEHFENTFFGMLSMLNELTTNFTITIHYNSKDELISGPPAFSKVTSDLRLSNTPNDDRSLTSYRYFASKRNLDPKFRNYQDYRIWLYERIHRNYQAQLGHFYRYIFNILKLVIIKIENKEARKNYINIIQAQLSDDQLVLIFYDALSKYGKNMKGEPQFFYWLDEYEFLQNVNDSSLLSGIEDHWKYPKTIFRFLSDEVRKNKLKKLE